MEHAIDKISLVICGVGRIDPGPLPRCCVDRGHIGERFDLDLELRVQRVVVQLLHEDRVVGISLEVRERLLFGDEADAGHPWIR